MHNIDWNDYRHPKYLQTLNLRLNELKILNLFLKRPNFRFDANQEQLKKTTLISPRRGLNSTKFITQEKVSVKI